MYVRRDNGFDFLDDFGHDGYTWCSWGDSGFSRVGGPTQQLCHLALETFALDVNRENTELAKVRAPLRPGYPIQLLDPILASRDNR